jgi:hypothetical protein
MQAAGYDFNAQLDKALPDEQRALFFLQNHPTFADFQHCLGKQAQADAYNPETGEWLEIKVDYTVYPNHFVERYSDKQRHLPGGPWQYAGRGVKYYVFFYKKLGLIHVFNTANLLARVQSYLETGRISDASHGKNIPQRNGLYWTYGYAINKNWLADICLLTLDISHISPFDSGKKR